ncbi:MAG: DUF1501 domain-containing protein [Planctomycetota bacterium]|nr:DUF1501 domain-containing protein [Planctomycetota bacterium]
MNFCPGPSNRREFLKAGALGFGGLCLSDILAGRAAAGTTSHDTSVILMYLHGGPSHLETYDLKPDAPSDYRSIYSPIATSIPGMDICELFPLQAKLADKIAIVRSCHHTMASHSDGGIQVLTGKTPLVADPTSQSKSDHPDLGHLASHFRSTPDNDIPQYVALPSGPYMTRPTYIGVQHKPLDAGDPSQEGYKSPIQITGGLNGEKLSNRKALLAQLDTFRAGADQQQSIIAVDKFRELAFNVLTSTKTAEAFDLSRETDDLKDRYGRNQWGQSALLARRLAEAGTGVITMFMNTPFTGQEWTNWDDHIGNAGRPGHFGKYMSLRLPYLDQCISALIEDIHRRNLEKKIMLVVMGEFGRTPRLSSNSGGVGRNHWPQAYSVLLSGGGLKTGQVVGSTNTRGEYPSTRPTTPEDILATVYHHLGVPARHEFIDPAGRPLPVLHSGTPIRELI